MSIAFLIPIHNIQGDWGERILSWTCTKWYPICDKETAYNTKTFFYEEDLLTHASSKIVTIMVTKRPWTTLHVVQVE